MTCFALCLSSIWGGMGKPIRSRIAFSSKARRLKARTPRGPRGSRPKTHVCTVGRERSNQIARFETENSPATRAFLSRSEKEGFIGLFSFSWSRVYGTRAIKLPSWRHAHSRLQGFLHLRRGRGRRSHPELRVQGWLRLGRLWGGHRGGCVDSRPSQKLGNVRHPWRCSYGRCWRGGLELRCRSCSRRGNLLLGLPRTTTWLGGLLHRCRGLRLLTCCLPRWPRIDCLLDFLP